MQQQDEQSMRTRRCQWRNSLGTLALLGISLTANACGTSLQERYYLMAMDRGAQVANVYRITLKSSTFSSKVKYSVGMYDRRAVDRLFGETALTQEHLDTEISKYNAQTGKRIDDLSAQIANSRNKTTEARFQELLSANATTAELLGRYRAKVETNEKYSAQFKALIDQAEVDQNEAQKVLNLALGGRTESMPALPATPPGGGPAGTSTTDPPLTKEQALARAEPKLAHAAAMLQVIRYAIDGKALVRFYDGSGNLVDTDNRKLVIFVATDVGRFSEALRQLAESEETSNDVLRVALSGRMEQERQVIEQLATSSQAESALVKRLDAMAHEAPIAAQDTADNFRALLLQMATTAAGKVGPFQNDKDIQTYVQGRSKP